MSSLEIPFFVNGVPGHRAADDLSDFVWQNYNQTCSSVCAISTAAGISKSGGA